MKHVPPAIARVEVLAPARLHLGFLDPDGELGRRFGGVGLALDQPSTRLRVSRSDRFEASGIESERAVRLLRTVSEALALPGPYRIEMIEAMPAHAGFGSGTQLALAIGAGLARLEDRTVAIRDLATIVERGARSAIGLAAFAQGGFVVDGGRAPGPAPPPVVARLAFPDAWRVLLVLDPAGHGLAGEAEKRAFGALVPFSAAAAGEICRLMLLRVLPALAEGDLPAFGMGISQIQARLGEYFAPAQGGDRWTSPRVGRLIERLGALGATGLGQTSWGPTGYAFVDSPQEADRLAAAVADEAAAAGLAVAVARGRNHGALILPDAETGKDSR